MMLGLHGRDNDNGVNVFSYFLALQLHKSVAEVEAMPNLEYLGWHAYFTAKGAIENKTRVT